MLSVGSAVRVYVAMGATDMRKSYDGLAALVRGEMGQEVLSGQVFVFIAIVSVTGSKCCIGTAARRGCAPSVWRRGGFGGRRMGRVGRFV